MGLMERVATLIRANLNELIDRAEQPETMLRQLVLDMENQLLQVKTQVAIALADQHLLEKKLREQEEAVARWHNKAELAVGKGDDALARAVLERALTHEGNLAACQAQLASQKAEAEALRASYVRLGSKLAETRTQCDLLAAQHRRARLASQAAEAHVAAANGLPDGGHGRDRVLGRVQSNIDTAEAQKQAGKHLLDSLSLEERLARLEKEDRVEQLLVDLKSRQNRLLPAS